MNDASVARYDNTKPVPYEQTNPDILQAMVAASAVIKNQDLDRALVHLVMLRASQINGCASCVKMHTKEAKEDGEAEERLERLIVWRHVSDFDEREKAALAWTESLTEFDRRENLGPLRARLRTHFSDKEIGALTSTIALINFWNRVQISRH
ncbi:MAG: carboxymuconolactone decarboxylase family protein [Variibacter sp.]